MKTLLKARTREEKRKITPIKPTKPNLRKLRMVLALSVQGLICLAWARLARVTPNVEIGGIVTAARR
jgi:hypothetical protein